MKVAINNDFGGFGLSLEAAKLLGLEGRVTWGTLYVENEDFGISADEHYLAYRAHPKLIELIEKLGCEKASGPMACLRIVDADEGWHIHDYDGVETIHYYEDEDEDD